MRLRQLVVHNVRGLRELTLATDDKSVVLVGPNGSGKSSVVDAIDLLLTGTVHRLQGEGAGGLSLTAHGKHVDASPKDAWVEATFLVEDTTGSHQKKPFVVRRTMKPPQLEPETPPTEIATLFERAECLGHHLLSRREILKFIMATPGDRRAQVASLLSVDAVEEQRKEVSGAAKDARNATSVALERARRLQRDLFQIFQPPARDEEDVLRRINEHRVALGAPAIAALSGVLPTQGLRGSHEVEAQHPLRSFENVLKRLDTHEIRDALTARFAAYAERVRMAADAGSAHADAERRLLEAGAELLEGDACPLCHSHVSAAELRARLEARAAEIERTTREIEQLRSERRRLSQIYVSLTTTLREIAHGLAHVPEAKSFVDFAVAFESPTLPEPTDADFKAPDAVATGELADALSARVTALLDAASKAPRPSARALAWVELQSAARKLVEIESAKLAHSRAEALATFLAEAERAFLAARDEVLDGIYSSIAARVETLYGRVHGDGARKTTLTGTKTGLEIEIDFHGRGRFPPSALHSEGQQDTLGICLFLALAERASGGPPPLIVLDDVLMSVDAEHRRAVAELLKREFAATQFVITTHDEVWARQLRSLGVVAKEYRFSGWTIEGGQSSPETQDAFAQMRRDLDGNRIPTAAHTLRRTLEIALPDICEALGARVRYHKDQQHDLGDFFDAAKSKLGDLMKEGIKCRQSWKKDSSDLERRYEEYGTARAALDKEAWAVNKAVHFNAWAQMNAKDFGPVVDAYERFLGFFSCPSCNGLLETTSEAVRCPCGDTTWGLRKVG